MRKSAAREPGEWVLLTYRMPRDPSTPRSAVWRKLRGLGVVQLADGLAALPADARIRVWSPPGVLRSDGWLVALDTTGSGVLVVRRPGRAGPDGPVSEIRDTVPLSMVHRLEVFRQRPGGKYRGGGALVGASVGAVSGALVGKNKFGDCSDAGCDFMPFVFGALGALLGGVVGEGVGTLLSPRRSDGWEAVQLPRRVGVAPVQRGVALTVRF